MSEVELQMKDREDFTITDIRAFSGLKASNYHISETLLRRGMDAGRLNKTSE